MKPTLALDIDDTLADTVNHFVRLLNDRYGNPEKLSPDDVVKKYSIVPNMKFWQTPDVIAWLDDQARSNTAQEAIPPTPDSVDKVNALAQYFTILYITSRPEVVREGTHRWLQKNGFPEGELIVRGQGYDRINGNAWKAAILEKRYPEIVGIVDDNPEIISALPRHYLGTVYLYGCDSNPVMTDVQVKPLRTWKEVYTTIITDFGEK